MSDDLVERARHNANADIPHHASVSLIEEMADRIEELEAELHTMKTAGVIEVAIRNPNVSEYITHWERRAEGAEAKLAKAMEHVLPKAMEHVMDYSNDPHLVQYARTILAELKGQDDE